MRFLVVVLSISGFSYSNANTTYLGLYLKGQKIGYASYLSNPSNFQGKKAIESDSRTLMDTSLLGTSMLIQMDSKTWTTKDGKPLRMWSETKSGGRSNKVDAVFGNKSVLMTIVNGGVRSKRQLIIPTGGPIIDDPLTLVINGEVKVGKSKSFFVFDSSTASFLKTDVKLIGPAKADVNGKKVPATLVEVKDSRSTMKIFIGNKNQLILIEGPAGINMLPVTRKVALSKNSEYQPSTDLAYSTSIQTDRPIENPAELKHLKLKISGRNLSTVPADGFQSVSKSGDAWIIDIHPIQLASEKSALIAQAAKAKPQWVLPSLNIPSDSPRFKKLAAKIIGSNKEVKASALAIQNYVYLNMKPNAGIGVLRDATEVLDTKEGVCRDYATLTVTILRAAGIPSRLVSGLVNWDGTFYYHAWAEAWDGTNWIGIDSTTDAPQISAAHVKLGDGNVDTAFSFTFLEKAKIEVLDARKD